jgi:hypothetical protein
VTLGTAYSTRRTLADAKSKKEAVALNAVMIRHGRMPTPEEAGAGGGALLAAFCGLEAGYQRYVPTEQQ